MENAQNPMTLRNGIVALAKDEEGFFRQVVDLEGNELFRLDGDLQIDADAGDEFYGIEIKYTDDTRRMDAHALRNLSADEEMFYSETPFGNIDVNENFITWQVWAGAVDPQYREPPYLFLREKNCFLRFDGITPGDSQFYIYGGTGLMWSATFKDGDDREYYKFELIDP